jgi:hypothetical protein
MNDTFATPTQKELDEYLRRGRLARSEALAELVLWLRAKLTPHADVPAGAKHA